MSLLSRMARIAVRLLSSSQLEEIANEASIQMMARMDEEEKVAFIQNFVEKNLGQMLQGLGREHRAKLMNSLLPKLIREFPLDRLDLSGTFSADARL